MADGLFRRRTTKRERELDEDAADKAYRRRDTRRGDTLADGLILGDVGEEGCFAGKVKWRREEKSKANRTGGRTGRRKGR